MSTLLSHQPAPLWSFLNSQLMTCPGSMLPRLREWVRSPYSRLRTRSPHDSVRCCVYLVNCGDSLGPNRMTPLKRITRKRRPHHLFEVRLRHGTDISIYSSAQQPGTSPPYADLWHALPCLSTMTAASFSHFITRVVAHWDLPYVPVPFPGVM